jgi:ATP-dependent helicase HepA
VYSLNAARIEYLSYQFRPVLKFIRSERPRLLIADGVGVGKTIEAGLILKELQARSDVKRVLIICTKPLVVERKWESEMRRFDERFVPLDGDMLRYCVHETDLDGVWPEAYGKCIVPYSLLDETLLMGSKPDEKVRHKGLVDLDPPPEFDLVIVDEASHVRNRPTLVHRCVSFLAGRAEALLLLTATPLEMGTQDLFVLLNLLRPDVVRDERTFEVMTAPNSFVNAAASAARGGREGWQGEAQASLSRAAQTAWAKMTFAGDPEFQALQRKLAGPNLDQAARVGCLELIESFHTLSGFVSRTRRRDIGDFTVRGAETIPVDFTPPQRELHDELLALQARILTLLNPSTNVKFLMTMIRRQAASCLYGLGPMLEDILTRRLGEIAVLEGGGDEGEEIGPLTAAIEAEIRTLVAKANALDRRDPKLEALRRVVREKVALPNRRLMVFSTFRHTLRYLHSALSADGMRVGLVHGDVADEDRLDARRRFAADPTTADAVDVLLFSEVGSEGLDYQFCDAIVNYDLPWNPMRIEQRIGRIDRRGQKAEKIRIINLITPGTVDADIYDRCLTRIGIFERELGASDEILGRLARELRNIAEDLALSPAERAAKLQQLTDNEVRAIREEQRLEDQQAELFALQVPRRQAEDALAAASSPWLSPPLLEGLVRLYLQARTGDQTTLLGDKSQKTLRLSRDARQVLLTDCRTLPRSTSAVHRAWEAWLKGAEPLLKVSFDQSAAADSPETVLLSPVHPLVRQAAEHLKGSGPFVTGAVVEAADTPPGDYPFAIYQWRFLGLQEDVQFRAIAVDEVVKGRVEALLIQATAAEAPIPPPAPTILQALESCQFGEWQAAREAHREATANRASFRRASLDSSHAARRAQLEELLTAATDERIRRLYTAELENLKADHDRRTHEIEAAINRSDLQTELVAFGVLRVAPTRRP